jgi:hypothetical protein
MAKPVKRSKKKNSSNVKWMDSLAKKASERIAFAVEEFEDDFINESTMREAYEDWEMEH